MFRVPVVGFGYIVTISPAVAGWIEAMPVVPPPCGGGATAAEMILDTTVLHPYMLVTVYLTVALPEVAIAVTVVVVPLPATTLIMAELVLLQTPP